MRSFSTFALVLVALAGCDSDDGGNGRADSGPIGACDCTPPTADDVSYRSSSSSLESDNVQDALDELAARPDPVDALAMRIGIVEQTEIVDSAGGILSSLFATCPPGGRALGVACFSEQNASLVRTDIFENQVRCVFDVVQAGSVTLTAKATCLLPSVE